MSRDATQGMIGTGLGVTDRHDAWWVAPLATALGFGAFIIYSTFRAFYNADFQIEFSAQSAHILSPFYSPLLFISSEVDWIPNWISPAFFILWMPGGFRVTCYYYRKAYYRAYFLDPPACAVGEARGTGYKGETRLFLLQNLHRYMLYLAIVIIGFLTYDVFLALVWPNADGTGKTLGMSVGTVVLGINVVFLSMYTFGCHSLRHLVGGKLDCFSCDKVGKARYGAWRGVTKLNEHHMFWAWVSLFMVGFADLYVWMIASGRFTDIRLF